MAQEIIKSPVEQFVCDVLPADRLDSLRESLPAHIRPEVFQRNLLNAVMINPSLMNFPPGLVFREVSKAAALGLFLDPQLGEAYMIVAYAKGGKEPQLRIGYRGMVKLARQSGEISQIYAHEVCEFDDFSCELGTHKDLIHKPKVFGARGPILGYYAVAKYRDGTSDFEPMSIADIRAIRDRSDAWKAFKDDKIKSTPWSTDEGEMAKKTVARRLVKRLPQSPELAEAIGIEDRAEFPNLIEERAQPQRRVAPPPPPPAVVTAAENAAKAVAEQFSSALVETIASEHEPAPATPYERGVAVLLTEARSVVLGGRVAFDPWFNALPEREQAELKPHLPELMKTARINQPGAVAHPPPPPPLTSPKKADVNEIPDPEKIIAQLKTALLNAGDEDEANDAYTRVVGPYEKDLFPPDLETLLKMLRDRRGELEP